MKNIVRLEELGFFLFATYLFSLLPFPWWYFPAFLLLPDLGMLGYVAGPSIGSIVYNIVHHRALALLYYVLGTLLTIPGLALAGVILFAHSSLDRVFEYGLKFSDSFHHTHLGSIGRPI